MAKRTQAQIEKDYKKIKAAAETVSSFKELEKVTGLSHSAIMVSLQKHPRVYSRIKKHMEEAHNDETKVTENTDKEQYIVIDASVTDVSDIEKILENDDRKVIVTSITVRELAKLQHHPKLDATAARARRLLRMAAEQDEKFVHKLIREDLKTPDDCILDFCLNNVDEVTLFTADKEMCNMAKAYYIPVKFFSSYDMESYETLTFRLLTRVGKSLVLDLSFLNTEYRRISVISNGKCHNQGMIELNIGDEILIACKKKEGYISFAHYKVVSLSEENNCKLICDRRIYSKYDMKKSTFNPTYKAFLDELKFKMF